MTEPREWDFPATMRARRGRRRRSPGHESIPEIEILPPEPEPSPRVHRIDIVHRRRSPSPQRIVIIAAFAVLALILLRSPGALILLAVIIPAWFWVALGVIVATLVIASIRERSRGRPF
jgi:hypothetical protein